MFWIILQYNSITIKTLTYNHSSVHYQCFGTGTLVVCLHGFGLDSSHFSHLPNFIPNHCFIAFDLPFHGSTVWNEGKYVYPEQLKDIILKCPEIGNKPFILLGYSIGGRLALTLLPFFAKRIIRLVLLAPDGFYVHPVYWFATHTKFGNNLLKRVTSNPKRFLQVLNFSQSKLIVPKSSLKFTKSVLENQNLRQTLYQAWTGFSRFMPSIAKLIPLIHVNQLRVILVYGKYDSTIKMAPGRIFHQKVPSSTLLVLETGHQLLHVKNASYLVNLFKI